MGNNEMFKFIAPFILIVFGTFLKITKNENYLSVKKYWLYLLLGGVILFLIRLYGTLHH
jgi:uncharacterized membrane protein